MDRGLSEEGVGNLSDLFPGVVKVSCFGSTNRGGDTNFFFSRLDPFLVLSSELLLEEVRVLMWRRSSI